MLVPFCRVTLTQLTLVLKKLKRGKAMEKFMFRFIVLFATVLFSSAAKAASVVSASAHVDVSVLHARLAEIIFVLEMVKLPIVLPILP